MKNNPSRPLPASCAYRRAALTARRRGRCWGEHEPDILSIASTHELLAQSGGRGHAGEVILNIKNNTMRYFSNPKCYVTITMEGGGLSGDLRHRHVENIIINELFQNS